ncbi:MAG: TonB-dependent receptor domain-containing protein, partial [Syntrophothermus sp.]
VTAVKNVMINKIDRKVFNVQQDLLAQSGTVTDMLKNVPSVSVDLDGNISLNGSGVSILINGRPSVMTGIANLEQMPASLVEKIEVITNPSAKYRPDGTGGIINIVLKKEQKAGYNGRAGVNVGTLGRVNANLGGNYNTGKFNLYGNYGFRKDYRKRTNNLQSETIDTATRKSVYLDQEGSGTGSTLSHLGQLGIDWYPSKKDASGISATINIRKSDRTDNTLKTYKDDSLRLTEEYTRVLGGVENENSMGLNAYYEHVFDRSKDHLFRMDIDFQHDREKGDDNWTNTYDFPHYPEEKDHTAGDNFDQQVNVTAEYSRPLWKEAELETGYELNSQVNDQDQQVESYDPDKGTWVVQPDQENKFHGVETVHALYATVSSEFGNFGLMGGLRAEEAIQKLDFISSDTSANKNYFRLYPTVHMSYKSGENEFQLSYSRRVNRPDVDDLNPRPEYRDPRNIFTGNPGLKPEDIHSFGAGYSISVRSLQLVPTLFYRYKINGFTMVTRPVNDTVLLTTWANLDSDQSAGLDISGTLQIRKIARVNASGSCFYNQIDATLLGYSGKKTAFSWNARISASCNITTTTIVQINGQFRSEMLTPQGKQYPSWGINLGFRQDFWKKKISFVATVSDLFNTQRWKTSINTAELVQQSLRYRDAPVFYAGLVLNLHSSSSKEKEKELKFEFDNGQ